MKKNIILFICIPIFVTLFVAKAAFASIAINVSVAQSADDAEECLSSNNMNITSSDLEMVVEGGGFCSAGNNQSIGMRFQNMDIPQGATIASATLTFTVDEVSTGAASIEIFGEDIADSPAFKNVPMDISDRTLTSSSVTWVPPDWNTAGATQQSDDISSVIQEIVDRGDWVSNNSLSVIIDGSLSSGKRVAESFNGTPSAPSIKITYNATEVSAHTIGTPEVPQDNPAPGTSDVPLATFFFDGEGTISNLTITEYGTADAQNDLSNVRLILDDGDGDYEAGTDTTVLGSSTTFNGPDGTASFTPGFAAPAFIHVLTDIELSHSVSNDIGVEINSESDITSTEVILGTFPIQAGTTLDIEASVHTGTPAPPSFVTVNQTDVYFGTFQFSGSGDITEIILTEFSGADADQDIDNLKLFLDDGDGDYEPLQDTTQLGSTTSFNASNEATFNGTNFPVTVGASTYIHIVFDTNDNLDEEGDLNIGQVGDDIGIEINNASDVTATKVLSGTFPIQIGPTTARVIYPYLQNATTSGITVMWRTIGDPGTSQVDYGLTSAYGSTETELASVEVHEVEITGLATNTQYHYRVQSNGVFSKDNVFRTAPNTSTGFTILAMGDSRPPGRDDPAPDFLSVVNGIIANGHNPRMMLLNLGDIATNGSETEWDPQFFEPGREIHEDNTLYVSLGNHEVREGLTFIEDYFAPPQTSCPSCGPASGTERYYSFEYGNVHFTIVDSNLSLVTGSTQHDWLVQDLTAAKAAKDSNSIDWIIVAAHHPIFTSSSRASSSKTVELRNHVEELLCTMDVDLYVNGHDHLYENSFKDGVHYLITGGAGSSLQAVNVNPNIYKIDNESVLHYCIIDVGTTSMDVTSYRIDGTVIHSFSIPETLRTTVDAYTDGTPDAPPSTVNVGITNQVFGTFIFGDNGTISEITVNEYGSVNAQTDLSNVKLFLDDGDGDFEPLQDTTQLGSTTSFDVLSEATFSGFSFDVDSSMNSIKNRYVHVVADVNGSAPGGATIGMEIDQAGDITSTQTVQTHPDLSFPVQAPTTTTQAIVPPTRQRLIIISDTDKVIS